MKFKKGMANEYDKEKQLTINEVDIFSEDYVRYVFDKCEEWAEEIEQHYPFDGDTTEEQFCDVAWETLKKIDDGMSAFQFGLIVSLLNKYWVYGDLLRKCHNKQYGVESEGVVNPAVISIGTKEE